MTPGTVRRSPDGIHAIYTEEAQWFSTHRPVDGMRRWWRTEDVAEWAVVYEPEGQSWVT